MPCKTKRRSQILGKCMQYNHELLTILMEECAEVIQEASKVIRFGEDAEYNGERALDRLEKEIGDLQCMIGLMTDRELVSEEKLLEYSNAKYEKLRKWSSLIPRHRDAW